MSDELSVSSSPSSYDDPYNRQSPDVVYTGPSSADSSADGWAAGTLAAADQYAADNSPIGAPAPTVTITVEEGPPEVDAGAGDGVDVSPDNPSGPYNPPSDPLFDTFLDPTFFDGLDLDQPGPSTPPSNSGGGKGGGSDLDGGFSSPTGAGQSKEPPAQSPPNQTSVDQNFTPADGSGQPNFTPNLSGGGDPPPAGPSPAYGVEYGISISAGGGASAKVGVFVDGNGDAALTFSIGKRDGESIGASWGPSVTYAPGGLSSLEGHSYSVELNVPPVTGSVTQPFTPGEPITTPPAYSVSLPIPQASGGVMIGIATEHDLTATVPLGNVTP